MDTPAEYTIDVYHADSKDGRLGPYHFMEVYAKSNAIDLIVNSLFGETVGGSRKKALRLVIEGWLDDDKDKIAKGEASFDGPDDEFYDYVDRIDNFITDRSVSIVCNTVNFDTKAFNEAVIAWLYIPGRLLSYKKYNNNDGSNYLFDNWLSDHQLASISWDDYVIRDYDNCINFIVRYTPFRPDDPDRQNVLKSLKEYLLGPGGEPIRAEFTAAVQSMHRATQNNQISPSTTSASPSTGKISQEQMFAMMLAPYGRCPKCNYPLSSRKVGLNAKKAALGGILAGPVGAIVGASSGKEELYCKNCGYIS